MQGPPLIELDVFCARQGFEGLALGTTFIRANFSTLKYLIYLAVFVLVSAIAAACPLCHIFSQLLASRKIRNCKAHRLRDDQYI